MCSLCDSVLERLGLLTSKLNIDGYTYLDLPFEMCPSLDHPLTAVVQMRDWARTLGKIVVSL